MYSGRRFSVVLALGILAGFAATGSAAAQTAPAPSSASSPADVSHEAYEAYAREDYATALALFRKAAEQGDAYAQLGVATMYRKGRGVPQDYAQAMTWLSRAAASGNITAIVTIGTMYRDGEGVKQDYAQAMSWFLKAADRQDVGAQEMIGEMYAHGQGVTQDFQQAMAWSLKAAEQGDATAQVNVGLGYSNGQGVARDYVKALSWFRKSAEREIPATDPNIVALTIAKAAALFFIGRIYEEGLGVPNDMAQATDSYRKAAELGNANAKTKLAELQEASNVKAATLNFICRGEGQVTFVSVDAASKAVKVGSGDPVEFKDGSKYYVRITNDAIEFGCRKMKTQGDVIGQGFAWMFGDKKSAGWASDLACMQKNAIDRHTGIWSVAGAGAAGQRDLAECSMAPKKRKL